MLHSVRQMLAMFSSAERVRFAGVFVAMLGMGILQMAGVGVILPFVSLLSDPGSIHQNAFLEAAYDGFGFESANAFLLLLGSILLVVLVGSNAVTAYTLWLMTHFAWGVQKRISARLLDGYLHQPYETFLNRNSAETGKNILIESQQFANGVLMPAMRSMAFGITALMIVGFLFWVNPLLALAVTLIFCGAYLVVYLTIRRALLRIGEERMQANTVRFQAVDEAFGSVKEVKVLGRENHFLARYEPAAATFAAAMAKSQVFGQIPRYAIEGLAFGIVMGAMLFVLASGQGLQSALPVASAFVVAGYRLLPALQNLYQGFAQWRFNQSVVDTLYRDLVAHELGGKADENAAEEAGASSTGERISKLPFEDSLQLRNVSYWYPEADEPSLRNVSVTISKNSFVALTGTTGAGKTTLADMILGLLQPSNGDITVDGTLLGKANLGHWQANIGYVPQEIYLTDSTVAGNIAYGLPEALIDQSAVERAARIANIHDFITTKLPRGYETPVGERGVRLSGGQRQRIGIARALYHDPSIIVLDEATSALDNETERRIVDELDAMRGGRTLIVIAHRLTTVQKCQQVLMLRDGQIAARGSYGELIGESAEFGDLADARGS
ncbi:ABC transporter ATP-binding protein [Salinisphaera sp.]|uniref:ABC transporter ATP-binding protein n=1 Tax=Salinisphaera sp. TaxID=1914330 RepID=UPI000C3DCDB1|nr:ABC transporter ATP-binding protein [Salinisphaera sp.]MBS62905.1 ABC transporter ATP-binding protein [Salinisphaera sp.]